MSLAQRLIWKPFGSLIFFSVASISSFGMPVAGAAGTFSPFCASVSSPRNQSAGGCSQKSFLLES